jgi:C4-dicarboxylate transporter
MEPNDDHFFVRQYKKKTDDEDVLENEEEETTDIEMAREIYYDLNQFLIKIIVIVIVVDTKIYFSNSKVVG